MISNVRDLAEWYPLLPLSSDTPDVSDLYAVACHILDIKVYIDMGAAPSAYGSLSPLLRLSGISDGYAEIGGRSIQVYVGRDVIPTTPEYVILDESVDFEYSGEASSLLVHPDCYVFTQQASTLTLYTRTDPDTQEQDATETEIAYSNTLRFNDGHNVGVSFIDGTVVFNGASGAGTGVYTTPPYSDASSYRTGASRGLRSFQGTENPLVSGGGDLLVSVEQLEHGISISLGKRSNAQSDTETE